MKRYRFYTRAEDFRPLKDMADIQMPWWCTGQTRDAVVIVCYLPDDVDLFEYWDDAFNIDCDDVEEIVYTDRFQKPDWIS